ncbi:hypothetical protein [Streptomyces chartreusis]|uniref:hypothetical protein n=1 Tax=Streptomyces chartreusis TaxID=1969 RepID=UPI0036B1AD8A
MTKIAVYHPWPQLRARPLAGWIKNMLLFFDAVAVIAPPSAVDSFWPEDLAVARPLIDSGTFRFLDPQALIDEEAADRILTFLLEAATTQNAHAYRIRRFNARTRTASSWTGRVPGMLDTPGTYGSVYGGRVAVSGVELTDQTREAAEMIWEELIRQGLARRRDARHPLRLHPQIWSTLEALVAHALRPAALRRGLDLQPATEESDFVRQSLDLIRAPLPALQAGIISSDLNSVGLDLSEVPLDDILDFREQYGERYREYAAGLRDFLAELGPLSDIERRAAFRRRKAELDDAAEELRRLSRRRWGRPAAGITLGIAGAAWTATHGDPTGAVLALLGSLVGTSVEDDNVSGAYTYVVQAHRTLV